MRINPNKTYYFKLKLPDSKGKVRKVVCSTDRPLAIVMPFTELEKNQIPRDAVIQNDDWFKECREQAEEAYDNGLDY